MRFVVGFLAKVPEAFLRGGDGEGRVQARDAALDLGALYTELGFFVEQTTGLPYACHW